MRIIVTSASLINGGAFSPSVFRKMEVIMEKSFYTIWMRNPYNNESFILEEEKVYYFKHSAFKRAKELIKDYEIILVRKVRLDSDYCLEWKFVKESEEK